MKTRRNPFLRLSTLAAVTFAVAGLQSASAVDYNIDTFTGGTYTWTTDSIWNPDATGGTGPLGADSIVISGDIITAATNINYAVGTAADRAITKVSVTDTDPASTQNVNLQPGVAGSKLEFVTTTPEVSTSIVNTAAGGQRLMVQNPWFTQASTTLTKGGSGSVLLDFVAADTATAFSTNVSSITSSGAGTLRLNNGAGSTITLPDVDFSSNNTRLTLSGTSAFTATGKTVDLGLGELSVAGGGNLTLGSGSSLYCGNVIMSSGNSVHFYMNGNSAVTLNGASASITNLLMGDQFNNSGTVTFNVQTGASVDVTAGGFLGGPNADGNFTQNLNLNVSGGSLGFSNGTNFDFNVGRNLRSNATTPANRTTVNGTLTISGGEVDLYSNARLVLAVRAATNVIGNNTGTLNLDGGTLKTGREIARGNIGTGTASTTTSARVFLNGGTLLTNAAIPNLFTAFTGGADGIFVSAGGAVIDTNGLDSGIGTAMQANTASTGGGLTKNGTGTLTLNAANTFTGDTKVNAGTLTLGNANALQNSTFDSGGAGNLSFGTLTAATVGGLTGAGSLILENTTPAAVTLTVGGVQNSTHSGNLSGLGGLTKTGSGILTLSGTNTYAGNTAINGGVLAITSTAALPGFDTAGRFSVASGATLAVGNSVTDADITTMLGTGNFAAGGRIGFDTTAGNRAFASDIGGTVGLAKLGGNSLTLATAQTYTGSTAIYSGTLALSGAATLPTGTSLAFLGESSLDLNGTALGVTTITTGTGTFTASATNGSIIVQGGGALNLTPAQTAAGQTLTLDFSGLSSFTYNNSAQPVIVGGGNPQGNTLDTSLSATTNTITASRLSLDAGTSSGTWPFSKGILRLGTTNTLNIGPGTGTAIQLSGYRSSGNEISFQGDPNTSTLKIRAADGTSRAGGITVSQASSGTNAGQAITATFDLGVADATVGEIVLADTVQSGTGVTVTGTMTMAGGTLDATSMVLGRVNVGTAVPLNTNTLTGSFTQSGGTASITTLTMGNVIAGVQTSGNQPNFAATYNLENGATLRGTTINANPAGGVFRNTSLRTLAINGGTLGNITGADLTVSGADGTAAGVVNIVLGGTNNTFEASSGQSIDIQATAPVSGSGNLVKTGAGTLSLKAANTYSGETIVSAGTLEITTDDTLSDAHAVRLASGTTLNLTFAGEDTVDRLYLNGVEQASGTWGSLASSATHKTSQITGTGILNVTNGAATTNNFASWASLNGVTGGPNGDHDNDGVKNLVEYALADGQERGTLTGNTLSFTKRGAPWGSDVSYAIETSEDLGLTDAWTAVTPVVNNATTISYALQNPGDNFARLKVSEN